MAKQYKPGQFIWVNGQKCRVTRTAKPIAIACTECERPRPCNALYECGHLPFNCYPKPV